MPAVRALNDLLVDLQQIERAAASVHGTLILDAFRRHTPFESGAVYFRGGDGVMRLAAKSQQLVAPEILDAKTQAEASVLLPLKGHREDVGVIALSGAASEDDLSLV